MAWNSYHTEVKLTANGNDYTVPIWLLNVRAEPWSGSGQIAQTTYDKREFQKIEGYRIWADFNWPQFKTADHESLSNILSDIVTAGGVTIDFDPVDNPGLRTLAFVIYNADEFIKAVFDGRMRRRPSNAQFVSADIQDTVPCWILDTCVAPVAPEVLLYFNGTTQIESAPYDNPDDASTVYTGPGSSGLREGAYYRVDGIEWFYWINRAECEDNTTGLGTAHLCRIKPDGSDRETIANLGKSYNAPNSAIDIRQSDGLVIFAAIEGTQSVYTCNIDGTSVTRILENHQTDALRWLRDQETYPGYWATIHFSDQLGIYNISGTQISNQTADDHHGMVVPIIDGIAPYDLYVAVAAASIKAYNGTNLTTPAATFTTPANIVNGAGQTWMDIDYFNETLLFITTGGGPWTLREVALDLTGSSSTVGADSGSATVQYQGKMYPVVG